MNRTNPARLLGVLILILAGCAKSPPVLRPGAINQFDQAAFDTLVTVQAALETASKEIAAFPALKPELNKAIDGFNSTQIAYKAYHEAVSAGKPADQAALDTLIQNLSKSVAAIIAKLHPPAAVPTVALLPDWRFA